jgi:hypothetical protein
MIESISRAALERHPAWAHLESPEDRETILGWGVAPGIADREIARFEFCGPQPLYPVLKLYPLPPQRHLLLGVTFSSDSGIRCPGYLLEPHAFGLFVGDREFCLNRHLAGLSKRIAVRLATALGTAPERLFPLRYESALRRHDGSEIRGTLERFW